jgi:UbiD family decarboxylase
MDHTDNGKDDRTSIDCDRYRFRSFLGRLGDDEVEVRRDRVPLARVAASLDGNRKAVWLQDVGRSPFSLAGNVFGSRGRMARAFGVAPSELMHEIMRRLQNRAETVEVRCEDAPVQQVVVRGDDCDLTALPIHLQHGRDGGPYISAGMDFSIDEATGWTNVGVRRFMLRGRRETGIDLVAPSDLRVMFQRRALRGEHLPLSIVVGAHPVDYFAAAMRTAPMDELGLLSIMRGSCLPVVKSVTSDIRVPADAECVIEGYLDARGYCEEEGPYGEFLGYYGGMKTNPLFRVTAITHRRDPVFQTLTISGRAMATTDMALLTGLRTEVLIWQALLTAVREPIAVYVPPATGGVYNVRICMRQRVPGEARNAIAAAFGSVANVKNVFVVDPDIDIFSDEQMEWALGTRFQPHRDFVVNAEMRTNPLDPSLGDLKMGSKGGFDLTLPFGHGNIELTVPAPPAYVGRRFASVQAALMEGPKFFEELMTAVESADGREIVLALEELRGRKALARDPADGKYELASRPKGQRT